MFPFGPKTQQPWVIENTVLYFQWAPPTDIYIYIYISNIDLAYIIAIYNICDNITHVLTFYLTYVLAFYLTHIQTLYIYIYHFIWHSLSHRIWHSIWHFIWHFIWKYLTYILTFHLALDLTYFWHCIIMTFSLEWYVTVWYILSGFYILFRSSEL